MDSTKPIGTFAFGDSDESFGGPLGVTEDAGFQEFSSLAISEPEAIKDKDVQNSEEIGFEAFQLSEDVLKGIAGLGWVHPLPVQAKAIPMILQKQENGRYPNIIAQAPTGKGKTGAFGITMIQRCDSSIKQPQVLCLAPTREIAEQTADLTLTPLGNYASLKIFKAIRKQERHQGLIDAQVIVGTAGTMFGHIKRKELDLSKVKMLVIDEADNMILNDEREVRRSASGAARGGRGAANAAAGRTDDNVQSCMNIKNLVPRDCQILLFSATFSKYALKFAENVAPRALHVKLQDEFRPVDNVTQIVIHAASKEEKYNALKEFWQTLDVGNVLIFCRKRQDADDLGQKLKYHEQFNVAVHHGNKTPEERERLVKEFREGKHSFLITTDVLSRGLDVPQVNFVINYDVPFAADDFVHRSGRAGRVHRKGIAITFTDNEPGNTTEDLKKILDLFPASFEYITLEASNKARLQEEILKIQLEAQ